MKNRTFIACLLAAACVTPCVSAQICANTGNKDNSITVSGTVSGEEAQILLMKPGFDISDAENAVDAEDKSQMGNVIEYFGQVTVSDKNIETSIPMRADAEKGKYLLVVNDDTCSVYFAALSERQGSMIPAAREALSNGSFAAFAVNDGKYFCNGDLYDKLKNGAKAAEYAAQILGRNGNPDDSEFMLEMASALNMGIIMEALNENIVDDFSVIKDMSDFSGITVPLDKIDLVKADKLQSIISGISGKNYASPNEYKKLLSESIFINVINNADNMLNADKKAFFETYAAALGLDLTSYNKLTENKKTEAVAKLAAENRTTLALLQSSLDSICKSSTTSTKSSGNGGGGGGGGANSGSGIRAVPSTDTTVPGSGDKNNTALSDLSQCEWARQAIEYLVSIGMISGYDDNTFKPLNSITRAEFVTIIARKYLPAEEYAQSFTDVPSDKWYFNYVESAYNSGIISGVGNGLFAPEANISRQDMAVILCRLAKYLGHEISGTAAEFADDASIAAYARDAIYSLKSAGIVNGDENGNFNPEATATRAEAAQMIYSFVKFLE